MLLPDLKTQASFVFLPQKFCGNSAKLISYDLISIYLYIYLSIYLSICQATSLGLYNLVQNKITECYASFLCVVVHGLPQNYDDIDMSIDQPKGEKVMVHKFSDWRM